MTIMQQPQAGWVFSYPDDFPAHWCVYHHYIPNETGEPYLIYIGACRLIDVYSLTDAKRNSEWAKLVKPTTNLHIRVIATGTRVECLNYHAAITDRPICNRIGGDMYASVCEITCNETNVTYATAADCARMLNIAQSSLSNHLARKPGHRSIKGMTFRKGR